MSAALTQIAAAAADLQALVREHRSTLQPAPALRVTGPVPALNTTWPGEGGIYAGLRIAPDGSNLYALILADECREDMTWKQGAAWAEQLEVDGHRDFVMPDRFEALQLRETVRNRLPSSGWMWTSTQYSADSAFGQDFSNGSQNGIAKEALGCVRAVRRLQLDPSILYSGGEA